MHFPRHKCGQQGGVAGSHENWDSVPVRTRETLGVRYLFRDHDAIKDMFDVETLEDLDAYIEEVCLCNSRPGNTAQNLLGCCNCLGRD